MAVERREKMVVYVRRGASRNVKIVVERRGKKWWIGKERRGIRM